MADSLTWKDGRQWRTTKERQQVVQLALEGNSIRRVAQTLGLTRGVVENLGKGFFRHDPWKRNISSPEQKARFAAARRQRYRMRQGMQGLQVKLNKLDDGTFQLDFNGDFSWHVAPVDLFNFSKWLAAEAELALRQDIERQDRERANTNSQDRHRDRLREQAQTIVGDKNAKKAAS